MSSDGTILYDDGWIACDDQGLVVRHYYPWGAKRIPYRAIRGVSRLPLSGASRMRRWRLWGSGDLVHWWSLDPRRPGKDTALVLDLGRRVRPTVTPADPRAVMAILADRAGVDAS